MNLLDDDCRSLIVNSVTRGDWSSLALVNQAWNFCVLRDDVWRPIATQIFPELASAFAEATPGADSKTCRVCQQSFPSVGELQTHFLAKRHYSSARSVLVKHAKKLLTDEKSASDFLNRMRKDLGLMQTLHAAGFPFLSYRYSGPVIRDLQDSESYQSHVSGASLFVALMLDSTVAAPGLMEFFHQKNLIDYSARCSETVSIYSWQHGYEQGETGEWYQSEAMRMENATIPYLFHAYSTPGRTAVLQYLSTVITAENAAKAHCDATVGGAPVPAPFFLNKDFLKLSPKARQALRVITQTLGPIKSDSPAFSEKPFSYFPEYFLRLELGTFNSHTPTEVAEYESKVQFAVEMGGNPNATFRWKGTFSHSEAEEHVLSSVALGQCNDAIKIKILMKHGADIHFRFSNGDTLLHRVVRNNYTAIDGALEALILCGCDFNAHNKAGEMFTQSYAMASGHFKQECPRTMTVLGQKGFNGEILTAKKAKARK